MIVIDLGFFRVKTAVVILGYPASKNRIERSRTGHQLRKNFGFQNPPPERCAMPHYVRGITGVSDRSKWETLAEHERAVAPLAPGFLNRIDPDWRRG